MHPTHLIVHCSDLNFGTLEGIRDFHINSRGWSDIGYHFVITNGYKDHSYTYEPLEDGKIYAGRPVDRPGAHAKGWNHASLGVCLVGKWDFTQAQLEALLDVLNHLMDRYEIPKENVLCHYEVNSHKTCPNLNAHLLRLAL